MRRIEEINKAIVKYRGRVVGYLAETDGVIGFQYEQQWLSDGFSISPYSLPLKQGVFVNKKDTFGGLFGVFADSLPDGWGELLITRSLARQGINYQRLSPVTKLTLVGEKAKGGLIYEPMQLEEARSGSIDLDSISEQIQKLLSAEAMDEASLDRIYGLGGSSGGARPKVYLEIDGEEWIVKFPNSSDHKDSGLYECIANQAAFDCGLSVNVFRLFPSNRYKGYFGSKRFDRKAGEGIHMVSLSSLLETSFRTPNLDYSHLIKVCIGICGGQEDAYEAFGRMCFNVLYGNKDDHGHNFSFIYDEERKRYRLSPFYDITKTPFMGEHQMSANGKGNPREEDLLEVGTQCGLSLKRCEEIFERIKVSLDKQTAI